jgi:Concanavalin A-like lectin/glucanases superfamily
VPSDRQFDASDGSSDGAADVSDTGSFDVRMDVDAGGNADTGDGCPVDSSCGSPSGPASHWTFDEGSGTLARDTGSAASSATHANLNGATWRSGSQCHLGGCLHFDGSSYAVTALASLAPAFGNGDFTVALWMYSDTNDDRRPLVNNRGAAGTVGQWAVEIYSTANRPEFHSGVAGLLQANQTFVSGAWNHVAVTRAAGTLTFYVNKISAGSTAISNNFTEANPVQFGRDVNPLSDLQGKSFVGSLDDVRFYRRALSAAEIAALP